MAQEEEQTMTRYVGPIEKQTLKNTYFRQVVFTGSMPSLC